MATILFSAAGAALGGSVGGTLLGLSMTAVGRFAGAVIGRSIDQRLLGQGSDTVETGKVSRLRLTGAGEGDAIAQVYGRMRVPGQVIWATEFKETVTQSGGGGGGKGAPSQPTRLSYRYSVSLAFALCEGEITHIGRIWADGVEVAPDDLTLRVYPGDFQQLPDPKIEAVEGAGKVPAYRGTAYVVIEDLDLTSYGNRVPQMTFEVSRPVPAAQDTGAKSPARAIQGVALLPGSGEYALATTPANIGIGAGSKQPANINSASGKTDFLTSLQHLNGELPAAKAASLVVSWFGDDLRCGSCSLRPKVEQTQFDAANMRWQVSGLRRFDAETVPRDENNRELYGGTPTDQAVIEAIEALRDAGKEVMYYPFILMDQAADNQLPDPYGGSEQAVFPWRGRITTSLAPGQPDSPDGTSEAEAQVAAFFGTARAQDFIDPDQDSGEPEPPASEGPGRDRTRQTSLFLIEYAGTNVESPVGYFGPEEWGYRRYILHQAALCAAAGGVEAFCIGSEMRGLTQIRGENNSFPAVQQLIDLAAEVRALLGPDVKIGYAADWSEYFGYQPQDGSGDRFFHLDALWADDNIDFIGIDNYMPLSDWREGRAHRDAEDGARAIYDMEYLRSNIEGGEGYDWFYHSSEARAAQIRTPITDGAHDEPWVFRYKDIRNWWLNTHHERIGGVRQPNPTAWVPQSKPVRFTEYGCSTIDKGTNQPNRFLDPKSSESDLPFFSNGQRDEYIQHQYIRAVTSYWDDPANNPVSTGYGTPMLDMAHAYYWAWDMRPYPAFPTNRAQWSDGANYARGHWLNGRASARSLASVVGEICTRAGIEAFDVSGLDGMVRGYTVDQVSDARSALQPLSLRYGFDAVERDGVLRFVMRTGEGEVDIDLDTVVRDPELDGVMEATRGSDVDLAGQVRLRFIEADGDFEVVAEEARLPDRPPQAVSSSEISLAMTRAEGRQTVERWLSESRLATDNIRLTLPPSRSDIGAGDVIAINEAGGKGIYRVDRADQSQGMQKLEAVRIDPESYRAGDFTDSIPVLRRFTPPGPVTPFFMDLPLLRGSEVPHAPHIAVTAEPWPGSVALYSSDEDASYVLNRLITARTPVGVLETTLPVAPAGRITSGAPLQVRMLSGQLESVSAQAFLGGANLCAIGDGDPANWELVQFREATLVDSDTYLLRSLLRGQLGTEAETAWPEGSYLVRLDSNVGQIELPETRRGLSRFYRIGPGDRAIDDPSFGAAQLSFEGLGLRPLSPVHLCLTGSAGADRTLSWIRRSRIDADTWEGEDVPLGEESERYLVRVLQGATLLREETTTAPGWTYTAAAQAADGLVGGYDISVAQISARFGAGRFATLTVPVG
ncbi:MAG: glycoside hydrolase TIM-barrel-like domain-containing protein [Pseudomonadota bacterium]